MKIFASRSLVDIQGVDIFFDEMSVHFDVFSRLIENKVVIN